jgi:hypothetical protein
MVSLFSCVTRIALFNGVVLYVSFIFPGDKVKITHYPTTNSHQKK